MTDTGVISLPLPDAAARDRIVDDLDTNLLVEAGAGSGKTTALVARMVSLITSGSATIDQIAAVTFTRKAAGELRERFQTKIETTLRAERDAAAPDELALDRLSDALDEIDRAFIGTIHSFCGRLLRERPLEIGLDPGFQELPVEERAVLRARFWESYLERLVRDRDPLLEELARSGLGPSALSSLFDHLVENPDVDFPAEMTEPPSIAEVGAIRTELEEIVATGWELMDDVPSSGDEWDSLQKKIRQLHFEREITGWVEPADLFGAVAQLCKAGSRGHDATLKRWRAKDLAKALKQRADAFGVGDTPANRLVNRWYAHRYALAIRVGRRAVADFAEHRLRLGKLDFQDLLVLAARLLRGDPGVRRQLGERYRRILIDEFQDTDPLQAEIMMLLSSPPAEPGEADGEGKEASGAGAAEPDWRESVPRPGALFVVGDPKQSIYRFRRADIQLYGFVKERFAAFGDIVSLSANFRSRPAIGDLVNDVFSGDGFFPEVATREQAAFERLDTRPTSDDVPKEGVFSYSIAPERANKPSAAKDDAGRIATWIRDRVDSGERKPGDFLILTRGRARLSVYARELEAHSLPIQVTGAGVGVENEIHELKVLLGCLIDPTNPVKVVSALVGLFFGIDYERLVAHRLEGGALDAMHPGDRGHPEVRAALEGLQRWWRASVSEPADVFVSRLASELGLLPYAASGELGSLRAGALLYALDAVRAATLAGDASLPGALRALESALDLREAEAPLEPGRDDAVRLMNLHQAKGLEGTVVILADPTEPPNRRPELHLTRSASGVAEGYLRVPIVTGRGSNDLARPMGWKEKEEAERRFGEAEEVRLLYVAATRAREELVVARWPDSKKASAWGAFESWMDDNAEPLPLESREPLERDAIEVTADDVRSAAAGAREEVASRRAPTFVHTSVTRLAKTGSGEARAGSEGATGARSDRGMESAGYRGFSWGNAVHGALAAAARDPGDEALRGACRDLLVQFERPLDDQGEPTELVELIDLVGVVLGSDLWTRAQAAGRFFSELAFAAPDVARPLEEPPEEPDPLPTNGEGKRQLDLFGSAGAEADGRVESANEESAPGPAGSAGDEGVEPARMVLEGVIDLAFREDDGWVIADYKTDIGTDPDFPDRVDAYRRQVELYADAWEKLTGEPVKERVLFFTSQRRVESW